MTCWGGLVKNVVLHGFVFFYCVPWNIHHWRLPISSKYVGQFFYKGRENSKMLWIFPTAQPTSPSSLQVLPNNFGQEIFKTMYPKLRVIKLEDVNEKETVQKTKIKLTTKLISAQL